MTIAHGPKVHSLAAEMHKTHGEPGTPVTYFAYPSPLSRRPVVHQANHTVAPHNGSLAGKAGSRPLLPSTVVQKPDGTAKSTWTR